MTTLDDADRLRITPYSEMRDAEEERQRNLGAHSPAGLTLNRLYQDAEKALKEENPLAAALVLGQLGMVHKWSGAMAEGLDTTDRIKVRGMLRDLVEVAEKTNESFHVAGTFVTVATSRAMAFLERGGPRTTAAYLLTRLEALEGHAARRSGAPPAHPEVKAKLKAAAEGPGPVYTPGEDTAAMDTKKIGDTLTRDAHDAAWRVAASQLVKAVRDPLTGLVARHLGPGDDGVRAKVARFLGTETGLAVTAAALSVGLEGLNQASPNATTARIARELRVKSMADMGDLVTDVIAGPLRAVMATYLKGVPGVPDLETPAALNPGSGSTLPTHEAEHVRDEK